jgi:hypothetical protein
MIMKKSLLALIALLLLNPLAIREAEADSRGSLTISATFGDLVTYAPAVRHRPAPTVIVVGKSRHDHYEKKSHRRGQDRHECDSRHGRHRRHYQEPTVVYYYSDHHPARGYRY